MTPMRDLPSAGLFPDHDDDEHGNITGGLRLFDDEDQAMDTGLSPLGGLPTAEQLFDDSGDERGTTSRRRSDRKTRYKARQESVESEDDAATVLSNVDMNASPYSLRRKRPSDQHPAGREQMMLDDSDEDDHDDMFLSPRASPTYQTLDGRTVTSKNPFSPYGTPTYLTEQDDACMAVDSAPSFPVTLQGTTETSLSDTNSKVPSIRPKVNLSRWGQDNDKNDHRHNRSGYPDSHGQYSFTGSPIEEIVLPEQKGGSKSRRLRLSDNATTAALFIESDVKPGKDDEISPTDVQNFPSPPSAPRKASRASYTPVKKAPPHTPKMQRRTVARMSSDEMDDSNHSQQQQQSRFHQDFDIIGELGTGSFGTVYKCLSRLDGCMYAVKAAKRQAKGKADRDRMLKEVYALAALSDQADTAAFHIVRYHQAWMEENRLYIQTELCSSTLQKEMDRGRLAQERKWKLLREMLLALKFIHRNGMVHLDIKPDNIFCKNDQFKLGDFGLVSKITNSDDVEEGDSRYMSRELLSGDHDDLTKSDIFSLGATMYEICLERPLPVDGQEWQNIRAGTLLPLEIYGTPYEMELIIKEMMHPDPIKRPTAAQLLKRKQLLSDEEKLLMAEKKRALEANMALAMQTQQLKRISPPRGGLIRANTWNGTSFI